MSKSMANLLNITSRASKQQQLGGVKALVSRRVIVERQKREEEQEIVFLLFYRLSRRVMVHFIRTLIP
jgi:hypothetical protein